MAIRINTNIASLNAQRNLGLANTQLNKTLERLSSGFRINRAADDAAGLAISEKLRTQIKGFTQAIANGQDAANLIATAESGLDQTTQILQRIRELSIQSSSDTLVNKDRDKIQVEIDELVEELDRVATTTEFNTRALLDGSLQEGAAQEAALFEIKANTRIGTGSAKQDMVTLLATDGIVTNTNDDLRDDAAITLRILQADGITSFAGSAGGAADLGVVAAGNFVLEVRSSNNDEVEHVLLGPGNTGARIQNNLSYNALFATDLRDHGNNVTDVTFSFNNGGATLSADDVGKTATLQLTGGRAAVVDDNALTFQVGANEGQYLRMGVQNVDADSLRLEGLDIVGADDDTSRLRAQNAIGVVDQALDYVNTVRSRLGAYQNRIEYRIANLQVARENMTASESRIRDTDVAAETANLTRAQILVQAGTAVLTQANISPQSALNLL